MVEKKLAVAIDGPAAAGKSTVAKIVAKELHYIYIDTGAMYRAITYKAIKQAINLANEKELWKLLLNTSIVLEQKSTGQKVLLDDLDVTQEIRSQSVTNNVSVVAQHGLVRKELVKRQRKMVSKRGIVMDGRDIGAHVIPDAEIKIFLIASVSERAIRRYNENIARGFTANLPQLQAEIAERDKRDSERHVSPLVKAPDAIEIDTTSLSIAEVSEKILEIVRSKGAE